MDDKAWERYGALGGVWFVVLAVIGGFIVGADRPGRADPAAEIGEWIADNDAALQWGAFLTAIGVIGLAWWFGTLYRAMRGAEEGNPRVAIIALAGFIVSGIGAMTGFSINAGVAAAVDQAGDGVSVFYGISGVAFGISAVGDVILALAVSGLAMRTGFLPRWVASLGLIVVVTSLIASIGIASDDDFFDSFGFIAFLIWAFWILAVSSVNYNRTSAAAA